MGPKELKVKCVKWSQQLRGRMEDFKTRAGEMAQWLGEPAACRGPRFDSHHPRDGWQPPVTPVLGDLVPSSDLYRELHRQTGIHIDKTTM